VRRVVVVTAQAEGLPVEGRVLTNLLLELGLLSVLAVAFAVAIYLLRRNGAMAPDRLEQTGQAVGHGPPRPIDGAQHDGQERRGQDEPI
jgi:hypothetical protein